MAENDIKVSELPSGTVDATSAFYMAKSDNSYQVRGKNIADYSVASQTQAGLNNKTPVAAINAAISNTADAFDDTASYAVGDLCIYENALYRFTTAKSAGAWDSNKVTATTLDAEKMRHIKDLPAGSDYSPAITPTSSHLLPVSDGTHEYKASVGDVVKLATYIVTFGDTKSSDQTTTNTLLVISSQSINLEDDMTIGCVFSGVMKTSRFTSSLCLVIDGNLAGTWSTNSTDFTTITGFHCQTLTAGSHTIGIGIISQDSGTTATLKSHNRFGGLLIGGI